MSAVSQLLIKCLCSVVNPIVTEQIYMTPVQRQSIPSIYQLNDFYMGYT